MGCIWSSAGNIIEVYSYFFLLAADWILLNNPVMRSNNSKNQISRHLMRINLREIKKASRLPRSSHHKKLQLEQPLRGRCHVLQPAAWTSQFLSSTSPTVPEPSWGNLRDEQLLKFSLLLSQCSTLSPEVGKIAAKEQAEMNVYTLSRPVFLGGKKNSNKNQKAFWGRSGKAAGATQYCRDTVGDFLPAVYCISVTASSPRAWTDWREHRSAKWNG